METHKLPPIHPGKILLEEFFEPMEISQDRLAKDTSIPLQKINAIVQQKSIITADTALRLGIFFGISPQFWMNLQSRYELEKAEDRLEKRLKKEVHRYSPQMT